MLQFIALALVQLAAAPAEVPANVLVLSAEAAERFEAESGDREAEGARRIEGQPKEQVAEALRQTLSGRTALVYQAGHGVFAEYTAPDGQLRMWYPNNLRVVRGSWGVRRVRGAMRACFRYRDAVNPVTMVYEPTECVSPAQTLGGAHLLRSWQGDVFGLMQDRIPYRKGSMDMPSPETVGAPQP